MDVSGYPFRTVDINSSRDVVETSIQNEIYIIPCRWWSSTLPPMGFFICMEKDKEKEGVFLWDEMLLDDRLTLEDVVLLSLYKSYSIYGKDKCCHMTGEQILEKLGNKMTRTAYQRAKRHLKELGLIECNGIVVRYKGCQYDRGVVNMTGGLSI